MVKEMAMEDEGGKRGRKERMEKEEEEGGSKKEDKLSKEKGNMQRGVIEFMDEEKDK